MSGLAPNHDQAGATTFCTASGKDSNSGTQYDGRKFGGFLGRAFGNLWNMSVGSTLGALIGSATGTTGVVIGSVGGTLVGSGMGSSGNFNLKRNVVSEVRATPASSKSFNDASFNGRNDCVDQRLGETIVNITSPIPTTNQ